ncbi:alpha/beta fold hydrolase [Falsiroseomonas selenitidurans]|uniref:Alpha/beta hydrolase n=1 Tax=Falsiroseomonas selenitidurans TaxID=2716335 RepID=A0ABX1E0T8_9PROT|nr:alpha/beta hydrolase [Falsiroseomonas selenitidurans]NKC29367.1 alpha/beta hydrolase [Falsiroseomonas selenitidurans]
MPHFEVSPGIRLAYTVDDFTDPWLPAPTVLLLHGLAESGEAFRAFVPALARQARVVRLDLRGYGESTPMPADHEWRFDRLIADVVALFGHLGLARAHVVGGKIGGTIAMALAARHPALVDRLAVLGGPASLTNMSGRTPAWRAQIAAEGVPAWVAASNAGRMGTRMPEAALAWWTQMMGRTAASTLEGFLRMVPSVDVTAEVGRIRAPTLVVTTTGSGLGSVAEVRAWQERIAGSRLVVMENDSYHVAASDPDATAALVKDFLFD